MCDFLNYQGNFQALLSTQFNFFYYPTPAGKNIETRIRHSLDSMPLFLLRAKDRQVESLKETTKIKHLKHTQIK